MGSPPSKESESNRGGRIGRRIMGFRKTSTSRRNAREGAREEDEGEEEGGTRTSAQRRDHLVIRELDSFFCPTLYEKEEERFLDERRRMKRSDSKKRKKKKKKKKKKEKKEGDDKGKEKLRGSAALRGMSSNSHQEAIGRITPVINVHRLTPLVPGNSGCVLSKILRYHSSGKERGMKNLMVAFTVNAPPHDSYGIC
ncbi:hypothetical protein HZH66_006309 [Vespula vulgaris]|uniref:Uncharacterized protein n=1 Tax=Vespula vulgaris TaxID=7454 RepID=A0A834K2Y6_VESVU|nr:hypothetical protein HZH66_006309 [Vespula vulgaris]